MSDKPQCKYIDDDGNRCDRHVTKPNGYFDPGTGDRVYHCRSHRPFRLEKMRQYKVLRESSNDLFLSFRFSVLGYHARFGWMRTKGSIMIPHDLTQLYHIVWGNPYIRDGRRGYLVWPGCDTFEDTCSAAFFRDNLTVRKFNRSEIVAELKTTDSLRLVDAPCQIFRGDEAREMLTRLIQEFTVVTCFVQESPDVLDRRMELQKQIESMTTPDLVQSMEKTCVSPEELVQWMERGGSYRLSMDELIQRSGEADRLSLTFEELSRRAHSVATSEEM